MSHHPFKVVLFTFLFTIIPAIMAVTSESWFYPGLGAFTGFLIVLVICWIRHNNTITALLAVSILTGHVQASPPPPPPPDPEPAVGIAVGVVVICVGGVCIYKLVKVCQKVFPPKSTNSNESFSATGEDEYAGAYEYSSIGSCYIPQAINAIPTDQPQNPTTFTLKVIVERAGVTTSMSADSTEGTTQTWTEFEADMASHGLFITGHPSPYPQFSMNGVPCDGAVVPLEFDRATGRVVQVTGGDLRRVYIERSTNLADWGPLLQTDVGVGTGFKCIDTTREGQMFYRVSSVQP